MRQRHWRSIGALSFCLTFVAFHASAVAEGIADLHGRVAHVADGDTVKIESQDGTLTTIRFFSVDTPEIAHAQFGGQPQPFADEASIFTQKWAGGQFVRVLVGDIDKYGRTIGTIILPNGSNLNELLVTSGYAWWYAKYSPKETRLARQEAEARYQGLGLWKDSDPLPPWIFRHPQQREDWEKNKCVPKWGACPRTHQNTYCRFDHAEGRMFDSVGANICIAREILRYQLCRGEVPETSGTLSCGRYEQLLGDDLSKAETYSQEE